MLAHNRVLDFEPKHYDPAVAENKRRARHLLSSAQEREYQAPCHVISGKFTYGLTLQP